METTAWRLAAGALALALVLAAAGCGRASAPPEDGAPAQADPAAPAPDAPAVTVKVMNFSFNPSQITLKRYEPVRIVLLGESGSHTFTAQGLNVNVSVGSGDRMVVDLTPGETGTFAVQCRFHRTMTGSIVVTD